MGLLTMAVQVSKKRKFVADGVFKAELNEFLTRELAEDGYSGVEVRVTPSLRHRSSRISSIQAHWRSRRAKSLLWRPPLHHGVWRQGLRGRRFWKVARTKSQSHEVCRRVDDPQR